MPVLSLSGTWDFRLDSEQDWKPIPVPGCWEALGIDKSHPGPCWYRKSFDIPAEFAGSRIWLRFGAVSYDCTITVNDVRCGQHRGMWDSFDVEITNAVKPGDRATLLLRLEKPATLLKGPDSESVAGSFPLKQTLAGFLPYVWGNVFGGVWQDVTLYSTGQVCIDQLHVSGSGGKIAVEIALSGEAHWRIDITSPEGAAITHTGRGTRARHEIDVPAAARWSVEAPLLHTVRVTVDGQVQTRRVGARAFSTSGSMLLINDQPVYPRMILSWGWYPNSLHSNPGPEKVRADFARLKSLGYNGVKLCLWFPPEYYFDIADEIGMLLWVELPMWIPNPTEAWKKQLFVEYPRLLKQAARHSSVILYTLGCELDAKVGGETLKPLYDLAKGIVGDALVRDNSGSGEAYGGLLDEFADFYDYHFYSDLQFFPPLLDEFSPRWKKMQPWMFGEFCDLDTFRDLRHITIANKDQKPWWSVRDDRLNPQGARWQFDIVDQEQRLRENGLWERGEELEKLSYKHALLHRKWTIETVRRYHEIGGYVITGEADTPISTAGMWDDLGQLKFDADEFRAFNDDLVVLPGWDRKRAWVNGGDRVVRTDPWCWQSGSPVRVHLLLSNYSPAAGAARVKWELADEADSIIASGQIERSQALQRGALAAIGVAGFDSPTVTKPLSATLHARGEVGERVTLNAWPVWVFPRPDERALADVALVDPSRRLAGLKAGQADLYRSILVIATEWSADIEKFVARGGRAILLQAHNHPTNLIPTAEMPFWREAVRLIEPHPSWGDFPHGNFAGGQFFGMATDCALDCSRTERPCVPILRRLDARTMRLNDYTVEVELDRGKVIVSTLRLEGDAGSQPTGIMRNVAARYLLDCWVRYLSGS